MTKKRKQIRKFALVKFDFDTMPKEYHKHFKKFKNRELIYFGEIVNMPTHGIFMDIKSKEFHVGYHIDEFIELTDKEL